MIVDTLTRQRTEALQNLRSQAFNHLRDVQELGKLFAIANSNSKAKSRINLNILVKTDLSMYPVAYFLYCVATGEDKDYLEKFKELFSKDKYFRLGANYVLLLIRNSNQNRYVQSHPLMLMLRLLLASKRFEELLHQASGDLNS
jgi:hypothetical protein